MSHLLLVLLLLGPSLAASPPGECVPPEDPPALSGYVVGKDGTPLPGLEVRSKGVNERGYAVKNRSIATAQGRFHLGPQPPGEITVTVHEPPYEWAGWGPPPLDQPALATFVVAEGSENVNLVMEGIWIVVGASLPEGVETRLGISVSALGFDPRWEGIPDVWGYRAHDSFQPGETRSVRLCPRGPVDALLLARAWGGVPNRRLDLTIPEEHRVIRHIFEFPSASELGSMRVIVRDPDGNELPRSRVTLLHEWIRPTCSEHDDLPVDESGRVAELSPGRYRVRVAPGPEDDLTNFHAPFLTEEIVEILPREEASLEVTATELGGRIRVIQKIDEVAERDILTCFFWGPDRSEGLLWFHVERPRGLHRTFALPVGVAPHVSQVLPPGRYDLELGTFHHGGPNFPVEVTAGEIVPVEVVLKPEDGR